MRRRDRDGDGIDGTRAMHAAGPDHRLGAGSLRLADFGASCEVEGFLADAIALASLNSTQNQAGRTRLAASRGA